MILMNIVEPVGANGYPFNNPILLILGLAVVGTFYWWVFKGIRHLGQKHAEPIVKTKPCVKCGKDFPKMRCNNCGSDDIKSHAWKLDTDDRPHGDGELHVYPLQLWRCRNCGDEWDSIQCTRCQTWNRFSKIKDSGCLIWIVGLFGIGFLL